MFYLEPTTWKKWNEFPVQTGKQQEWFLQAGKKIGKSVKEQAEVSFVYDPENPVSSHGAESLFASQAGVGSISQPRSG